MPEIPHPGITAAIPHTKREAHHQTGTEVRLGLGRHPAIIMVREAHLPPITQ